MYQNQEYKNRFRILKGGLISLVVASNLYSAPNGGIVVSGSATINQNGNITNINQFLHDVHSFCVNLHAQ